MQEFYIHQNCLSINEGKISIFPDKQKMKEFMLAYPLVKDTRNLSGRKQVTPDSNSNLHGKRKNNHKGNYIIIKTPFITDFKIIV